MTFYIGPEVNQTPAFSKRTLFVEGLQDSKIIETTAKEYKTPHISLAANDTFDGSFDWNAQLVHLLSSGFMVTLEYPAELHSRLLLDLSAVVLQSRQFVPLVKVNIMGMSTTNPNLTVKFDDNSNVGVWALHYHQIMDSNRYTALSEFDMVEVAPCVGAVPNPVLRVPVPVVQTPVETLLPQKGESAPAVDLNPQDLGLDPTSPSMLKPEDAAVMAHSSTTPVVSTPADAAELYAGAATTDPLSAEASKKPTKKKS